MSCKHALLRHNVFTLLRQTLSQKSFKKSKLSRNSPKNKQKILPWKHRNPETCLKWRTWGVKNRNVKKKNKKGSWLWEILLPEPRVICLKLSFLTDIQFFFQVKLQKNLLNTAGYSCIVCHWNIHCSGTTHSHFCIKHL